MRTLMTAGSLALFLASNGTAQERTWVVDFFRGPNADFDTIQAAVDAAADGDTILVGEGGRYPGFTIDDKALVIVGHPQGAVDFQLDQVIRIRNLAPGKTVELKGLGPSAIVDPDDPPALEVRDCAGTVWLEDCSFAARGKESSFGLHQTFCDPAVTMSDSESVVMTACRVQGSPGVVLERTGCHFFACEIAAAELDGATATPQLGQPGLLMDGAFAYVSGGTITGGIPSIGCGSDPCSGTTGPGVELRSASELFLQDTSVQAGTVDTAAFLVCVVTCGPGTGFVQGPAILQVAVPYTTTLVGALDESGALQQSEVVDDLGPGVEVLTLYGQGVFLESGGGPAVFAGSGASTTLLDASVSLPVGRDCNLNGIHDAEDLRMGISLDCNENEIPDECEPFSPAVVQEINGLQQPQGRFGWSINIEGDVMAVGRPGPRLGTNPRGRAYLYERQPDGTWVQTDSLFPADPGFTVGHTGSAIALDGNLLAVGAESTDGSSENVGGVYLYENQGGTWVLVDILRPANEIPGQHFGSRLDLQGDTLVVGAPGYPGVSSSVSSTTTFTDRVFVFERTGGIWNEVAEFGNTGAGRLGSAVALDGDTIVVGNQTFEYAPRHGGLAHVFERNPDGTWPTFPSSQLAPLELGSTRVSDLGQSLAIEDDVILVGGQTSRGLSGSVSRGSVYLFQRDGSGRWPPVQQTIFGRGDVEALVCRQGTVALGEIDGGLPSSNGGAVRLFRLDDLLLKPHCKLEDLGPFGNAGAPVGQ